MQSKKSRKRRKRKSFWRSLEFLVLLFAVFLLANKLLNFVVTLFLVFLLTPSFYESQVYVLMLWFNTIIACLVSHLIVWNKYYKEDISELVKQQAILPLPSVVIISIYITFILVAYYFGIVDRLDDV